MKEAINKMKENTFLKFLIGFVKTIMIIFIVLIVSVILVQRVSNNNLSIGGLRLYTIISGSMIPRYDIGDMLLAKETDINELKVGDDVVYNGKQGSFAGKTVVHRIIKKNKVNGQWEIITKGIANDDEDPAITESQIVGKIIYKTFILSFLSTLMMNNYAFYFVIFVPIVVLVFIEVIRSVKEKKKEKENNTQE